MIKKAINFGLNEYKNHKKVVHQTGILFFSQIFVILMGIASKGFQTRALSPADYGLYAFFGTIIGFTVLFFRFGLFNSTKVLLANNNDEQKERELFGAGFFIGLIIGLIYAIFIFGISFFIDDIFNINFGNILRLVSPFCFILPFNFLIPYLAIGSNKIENNAIYNFFSKLLYLVPLVILFFYDKLSVIIIILLHLLAIIITSLYLLKRFKPLFTNIKIRIKEIFDKNKSFGWHYYCGAVLNQTTYGLDGILITYFINPIQLGFYSLAGALCSPMVRLSQSFSDSLFKKFGNKKKIPRKVFIYNSIWLIFCIIFLFFFSKVIIILLFGPKYLTVSKYVIPLSFAYLFQGLYKPFTFLSAKSKGREIRNVAIIETIINVAGNFILIPLYGVMGAIFASIAARLSHLLGLSYYYKQYLKEIKVIKDI